MSSNARGSRCKPSPWRLRDKAGRAAEDIPIVVGEMVEARLGDGSPWVGPGALEGDDEVKGSTGDEAPSARHRTRPRLVGRYPHRSLVRMRGETPEPCSASLFEKRVKWIHRLDLL